MKRIKNRAICVLATIMLAAFLMPMTAYATELPEETPGIEVEETADNGEAEDVDESDGLEETGELLDGLDMDSDVGLELFFGLMQMAALGETDTAGEGKPFTPDGQATVVDLAYEGDGKMFYTFSTPAGNVFYLVIDRERETDNVYFLNAVTEADLLALAEDADENIGKTQTTSAIPTPEPVEPDPDGDGEPQTPEPEVEQPPEDKGGNTGMIIFLLIGGVAFGGAAYYFKILRPKQQADLDDDDDDSMDEDDDGEEMQFEDEPEDSDDDTPESGRETEGRE